MRFCGSYYHWHLIEDPLLVLEFNVQFGVSQEPVQLYTLSNFRLIYPRSTCDNLSELLIIAVICWNATPFGFLAALTWGPFSSWPCCWHYRRSRLLWGLWNALGRHWGVRGVVLVIMVTWGIVWVITLALNWLGFRVFHTFWL